MNTQYIPFQPTLTQYGLKKFGLILEKAQPVKTLKGIVHSYLQIKSAKPTLYPVIPDGTQAIYMSPEGLMIGGAQLHALDIQLPQPGEYFGIWFYPGSIRHLFDFNLSEITGQFVDKNYFQCNYLSNLHTKIYALKTFAERAKVCENWILRLNGVKRAPKFDQALSLIFQSRGNESVNRLANIVGWSNRHLNRQFLQHTGLSTKSFSQMIDEIDNISAEGGKYHRGQLEANLKILPNHWFFACHFEGDPVMPGCLGLDALWQLLGVFLGWSGLQGKGRALGVGKVKFSGQIYPDSGSIQYLLHIKRIFTRPLPMGVADGSVIHDGRTIYEANDLRVGLIKGE